jgi:RHS repeat-associated protein
VTDANKGITGVAYDAHDRPTKVTDANGNSTLFVFDGFGDAIQQTSPDSGITVYHYDSDGNLTSKTDALGIVTNRTFDALDRVLTTTYPADTTKNLSYTYDQTGTAYGFGVGRLTSVKDAAGSLIRSYDERGNLLEETRVNGTKTLTTAYTYDPASRMASMTYPDGTVVRYSRDLMGQIAGASAVLPGGSATTLLSGATHLPFGPMNAATYGNGIAETWAYDADYRAMNIADALSGKNVQNLSYAYDNNNNVKTITDAVNTANTQTLGYDVINRLVSAVSGAGGYGSQGWTYDKVGNRLTQILGTVTTNYDYTPGTNRVASIGSVPVTTNANGNIPKIPPANSNSLATFIYSVTNRLSSVTGSPVAASFTYDWAGQRFSKTDSGSLPILYSYMQGGTLIAENDNGSVTDYIYADGRPIADLQPESKTTPNQINYILADRLGTPQLAVNSVGTTVWRTTYQPFGTTGSTTGSIIQNLRFPGQYADTETGFNYNLNRDYMPNLGRYLESDPTGLRSGPNTFQYANSNSDKFIDPSGFVVTMTCSGIGVVHCADFVWHWVTDPCTGVRQKVVDAQYSLGYGGQKPVTDQRDPQFWGDRWYFYNPGMVGTNYDIPVPQGMTSGQFDQSVMNVGNSYSQDPYFMLGPNSNTAANSIITEAGGTTPDVPGAVGQYANPHFSFPEGGISVMVPIIPLF